jgi:hypothetical protein
MPSAVRRTAGGLCASLAVLAAWLAYAGFQARALTSDPAVFAQAAGAALADPEVVDTLTGDVADALAQQLRAASAFTGGLNVPRQDLEEVARAAVTSEEFTASFADTLAEVHDFLFGTRTVPPTLDTRVIDATVQAAAEVRYPAFAALLGGGGTEVAVPVDSLPDLRRVPVVAGHLLLFGPALALAAAVAALALHPSPHLVLRRFGRWGLLTGGLSVAVALLGPSVLRLGGATGAVAAPFVGGLSGRFVAPGTVLLVVGSALLATSVHLGRRAQPHATGGVPGRPARPHWAPVARAFATPSLVTPLTRAAGSAPATGHPRPGH